MALKSKIGTTSQVLADLANIGIETSVTITDNLYTATNLLAIIAKTNKTITLQNTAAGDPADMTTTAANLVTILAQVNKYTGPLEVDSAGTATAEQLDYIAKKTTGVVTAELVNTTLISKATVDALKDVSSSDNITFTPTAAQSTLTGKAALEALVALDKKLSDADWANVATFNGAANEVNAIKAALEVKKDTAVNITSGQISAADANALVVASNGVVTANIKDGSVEATLKALKDVDADAQANILKFKTTDRTADAMAIFNLDDLLGVGNFDGDSVKTITSKAADAASLTTNVAAIISATNADAAINITNGTITATQAATISAATTGKVTANIATGDAATIASNLTTLTAEKDALSITVNGANADGDDLLDLDAATSSNVKVDAATVTAATFAEFEEIYVINKNNFSSLGDENIIIDATAADMNSAKADIVAKATSKVAKATIAGESAASVVTNLKNANAKDAFTINLAAGTASAKDLLTLDGKTSVAVGAGAVTEITGTVADVNKVIAAGTAGTITLNANPAFTLSGSVKAADANFIMLNTTGVVKANIAANTAENLVKDLANAGIADKLNLIVNGAKASAADLITLAGKTAVATNPIKVDAKEVTGDLADIKSVFDTNKGNYTGEEKAAVKIDGTVAVASLSDLNNILNVVNGKVTATVAAGAASALATGLANAKATDALTLKVTNESGIALTDAANLLKLDGFTSVKVDATGITNGITGSAADLKAVITSKGIELAKGVDITVTDPISAADLNVILKSTLGAVTASVTDTAAKLNAALKDASSSDVLTLVLSAGTAAAKDLLALDGKTSVPVNASAVTAITGTFVDVQKVVDAETANTITLGANVNYTISGTVTAAQAEIIADSTGGVVTATVAADNAANLVRDLADTDVNAYKLTVSGNDANASDLNSLDDKTSLAVNANAIKNIIGTGANGAEDVRDAYLANAKKDISGLGNETVNLTGADDADAALVKAINDYTTGLITLPTITFENAVATTFSLNQLGDLKGITGLVNIDATNTVKDTISISLNDLLAANDSKNNFTFKVTGDAGAVAGSEDSVKITNDLSGWTQTKNIAAEHTYTNGKTGQVVTIELVDAVFAV